MRDQEMGYAQPITLLNKEWVLWVYVLRILATYRFVFTEQLEFTKYSCCNNPTYIPSPPSPPSSYSPGEGYGWIETQSILRTRNMSYIIRTTKQAPCTLVKSMDIYNINYFAFHVLKLCIIECRDFYLMHSMHLIGHM